MKKIFTQLFCGIWLIVLFSPMALKAQSKAIDSGYRSDGYVARLEKFKTDPISKNDVVFLGNSITAGTNWAKLLDMPRAINRGISGDITFGILNRLQEIIDANPRKIFILIGTNDIAREIPDAVIVENYKRMLERIKAGSSSKVYFFTILPVNKNTNFQKHKGKAEHINRINSEMKKLASKRVKVIDLYSYFVDGEGQLKENLSYDGLHLNEAGYQEWAKILRDGDYLK
ncbi:GDSL-type esterase/lipase family protein [Pedobacter gandavensis]|uniref:GDSL-type esterase/lipase family protein n=1 Tax=Pedobacter gandavensis TaxID=2679963 RepID=UPI00292DC148|nr:GDSL-type esterase/lipase family protein [Pedobacter gandavensis]